MAFHVHIDLRWRVGAIRFVGRVTGGEIIRAVAVMLDHADWKPGYRRLTDSTAVSMMDITPDDFEEMLLQEIAEHERIGSGRKAMIVPPRLVDISAVYKHSVARGPYPYEMEVFTEGAAAWRWLCGPCADDADLTRQ